MKKTNKKAVGQKGTVSKWLKQAMRDSAFLFIRGTDGI